MRKIVATCVPTSSSKAKFLDTEIYVEDGEVHEAIGAIKAALETCDAPIKIISVSKS